MQIISRSEAQAQGLKRYFTGEPCKRGHVGERLVSNGCCCLCLLELAQRPKAKAKHRATSAAWAKANPERRTETSAAWAKANPEKVREKAARWRAAHPEKVATSLATYRMGNKEHIRKAKAVWNAANKERNAATHAAWGRANPGRKNAATAIWAKENPSKVAAIKAQRRAAKLQRTPKWLSKEDKAAIKALYEQANFIGRVTGEQMHVDHILPLQGELVSGLHVPLNLQILTATENIRKKNKYVPPTITCD